MSKKRHIVSLFVLIIAAFIFGRSTYNEYLAWYYGSDNLIFSEINSFLLSSLFNGLYFALSSSIIYALLTLLKEFPEISSFLVCCSSVLTSGYIRFLLQ